MRWLIALLTVIPTTLAFGQVRSVEPIAPGLPFTGPDSPATMGVISADGKVLAFTSSATNLTPGVKPGWDSLYVQTLSDRRIRRLPTTINGSFRNILLDTNGRRVAFSDAQYAYVYDRPTDSIRNLSYLPDGKLAIGTVAGMSGDGSKFLLRLRTKSSSTYQYYIYDYKTRETIRVQLNSAGQNLTNFESPKLTNDGSAVCFRSKDSRLVGDGTDYNIYRKTLATGKVDLISNIDAALLSIDSLGTSGLLRSGTPGSSEPLLLNFVTGRQVKFPKNLVNPRLSPDGNYVFGTLSNAYYLDYGPIVAYRISDGVWSTVLSQAKQNQYVMSVSHDGSRLVYARQNVYSWAIDVCDRNGVTIPNIDANLAGSANGMFSWLAMSASGSKIAYSTVSTNLVAQSVPGTYQVYVRDLQAKTTTLESVSTDGTPVRGDVTIVDISSNGRYVAYSVRRVVPWMEFVLVVRDLQTRRNVGQRSYKGWAMQVSVKNDGRTAVSRDDNGAVINFFDPVSGTDQNLSAMLPEGSRSGSQVWVTADGDDVIFSAYGASLNEGSLLRYSSSKLPPRSIPLPTGTYPLNVSDDGNLVGLYTSTGHFRLYDVHSGVDTALNFPSSYSNTAMYFSGNGRYVCAGQYVYDMISKQGWFIDGNEPAPAGITNGADPVMFASQTIGDIQTGQAYAPYLVRLDQPAVNPFTFIGTQYYTVRGTVTLTSSGHSFQESAENLKFQFRVGSGVWGPVGPAQQTLTLPYDGVHTVSIRCVDSAGRVDLTPATVTVTSDSTPPTLRVNARAKRSTVKIEASASEGCNWILRVRLPSGAFVAEKYQYGAAASFEGLVEGLTPNTSYEYELVATDRAGLQATATGTFQTGP